MAIVTRPEPEPGRVVSPLRHVNYWALWFGFLGSAAAWSLHEVSAYAVVAHSCYPDLTPFSNPQTPGTRGIAAAISAVLLVVALLSLFVSAGQWRHWRSDRAAGWREEVMEASTLRSYRYLSFSGILLGVIFSAIIAYSLVATLVLQTCSY